MSKNQNTQTAAQSQATPQTQGQAAAVAVPAALTPPDDARGLFGRAQHFIDEVVRRRAHVAAWCLVLGLLPASAALTLLGLSGWLVFAAVAVGFVFAGRQVQSFVREFLFLASARLPAMVRSVLAVALCGLLVLTAREGLAGGDMTHWVWVVTACLVALTVNRLCGYLGRVEIYQIEEVEAEYKVRQGEQDVAA
jgi:hypothetical protein